MANAYRGQVDLRIEGDNEQVSLYKLHYDGNALVEIEEVMGMPINTMLREHVDYLDGNKFKRAALFYGLQRDPRGRKLTLKQCGELIASPQGKEIAHAVVRGVFLALGVDIDEKLAELEAQGDAPGDAGDAKHPLEPVAP